MPNAMQRVLRLRGDTGVTDVVIDILWPERHENSWLAEWVIRWPDRERKGTAGGSDAIQALNLALKLVGTELYCSAEHEAGRLSWSDDWTGYGFPVPTGIRDLLIGDDKKNF